MDDFIDAYLAVVPDTWDRHPQSELNRAIAGAIAKFGGKRRRARAGI
jgi:hypothetical protein